MSKKDSIKEDIATLRTFSILFLTSIFGVLGYAITNFEKLTNLKLIVGFVSLFLLVMFFVISLKLYKRKTKLLEELE
ncbi:Uncharacterised protein [Campylobacter hyointestinalis]|uniref:Uncharacterized protein n=1 Tax=Campylobacter hyointestinalis subsp. hyointestinalis TaxID=91352 RepID=A0A9W5EUZ1_CAMHY|nr:hypothetical protein [Campylobacter hyointestinalis]EAL5294100.1 hypothetical protein [Campylobacter jejuni]PPB51110.1 hypothetical protein CDQ68_08925 [Campylobacter hyointestinalis subsp. hyointestinalis]PPB51295.1 hypothetical protein CDQ69_09325 [Campylobacter hyointestinalis subsp. hyointestinalis]PPB51674.1 hypothetical protein CDQ67_10085 [Campylobacter hyointestinalis subsp. hyointestinalis]PPB59513.1 hypothetical protein CDQ72_09275 [Campylobacter hyointestinalis subsp. hyointestin